MSFASAHNDYLDPDKHLHGDEHNEVYEALVKKLKERDSGRWQWDEIDCCWTGKYADLDPWGYQGLHLDSVDDDYAYATAHIGKTFVGDDVTLNVPKWVDEEESLETLDKVRDIYMEQAQEVVCGCNVAGEWDGDSWFMSDTAKFKVAIKYNKDGEPQLDDVVDALVTEGEKALADIERELVLADEIMNTLAGWTTRRRNGKKHHHKEGRPCRGSAWWLYQQQTKGNQNHD